MTVSTRPKYLNLFQIRLPVPGFVSILHRISGFGMFLFAWALLWLLQLSLQSPETFEQARQFAQSWIGKLFLLGISWAFLHHFFAGQSVTQYQVGITDANGGTWSASCGTTCSTSLTQFAGSGMSLSGSGPAGSASGQANGKVVGTTGQGIISSVSLQDSSNAITGSFAASTMPK